MFTNTDKKHLKNVGPIRLNEPPHANSPDVTSGTVARHLRIDVYDNDDNDNVWQRGPLWPHGMGPKSGWQCCWTLTNFIPQLAALVGDRDALCAPQRQPRVGQELFSDERQHTHAVAVTSVQHLANLQQTPTVQQLIETRIWVLRPTRHKINHFVVRCSS